MTKEKKFLFGLGWAWLGIGILSGLLRLLAIAGIGVSYPAVYVTLMAPAFFLYGLGLRSEAFIVEGGGVVSLTFLSISLIYILPGAFVILGAAGWKPLRA